LRILRSAALVAAPEIAIGKSKEKEKTANQGQHRCKKEKAEACTDARTSRSVANHDCGNDKQESGDEALKLGIV
jgi:hypothetical protein